jgi:hypothetical protein
MIENFVCSYLENCHKVKAIDLVNPNTLSLPLCPVKRGALSVSRESIRSRLSAAENSAWDCAKRRLSLQKFSHFAAEPHAPHDRPTLMRTTNEPQRTKTYSVSSATALMYLNDLIVSTLFGSQHSLKRVPDPHNKRPLTCASWPDSLQQPLSSLEPTLRQINGLPQTFSQAILAFFSGHSRLELA